MSKSKLVIAAFVYISLFIIIAFDRTSKADVSTKVYNNDSYYKLGKTDGYEGIEKTMSEYHGEFKVKEKHEASKTPFKYRLPNTQAIRPVNSNVMLEVGTSAFGGKKDAELRSAITNTFLNQAPLSASVALSQAWVKSVSVKEYKDDLTDEELKVSVLSIKDLAPHINISAEEISSSFIYDLPKATNSVYAVASGRFISSSSSLTLPGTSIPYIWVEYGGDEQGVTANRAILYLGARGYYTKILEKDSLLYYPFEIGAKSKDKYLLYALDPVAAVSKDTRVLYFRGAELSGSMNLVSREEFYMTEEDFKNRPAVQTNAHIFDISHIK